MVVLALYVRRCEIFSDEAWKQDFFIINLHWRGPVDRSTAVGRFWYSGTQICSNSKNKFIITCTNTGFFAEMVLKIT